MTETFVPKRHEKLMELSGFRVEIDPERERADIILDRPPLNIIEIPQRDQLRLAFEELDEDDRVRVIVLRAEGKNFSSGGNIAGFLAASPEHVSRLADNIAAPARCNKPVIAANRGYTFGVGFEISLACDFRIASETTQYALPEQRIGQIPGSGGSIRLLHMIGMQRTKDMTFRSRQVSGTEAKEWGFILDCVPDPELEASTNKLADELREFSPLAQRTIKGVLNAAQNTNVETGIEIEGNAYGRLRMSADFAEGVAAFHGKRKASFTGY
ncbi:MAG: crotonase [Rhodospirillaceae bacterium]|nr:crotonase [Rhodospirillaceae bacterium]